MPNEVEVIEMKPQARQEEFLSSSADIAIYGGAAGGGRYNACMIKIYSLVDPLNNEVRYVGQTTQNLPDRLRSHVDKSKRYKDNTAKAVWIRKVLDSGNTPSIHLLEMVDDDKKREAENKWISFYPNLLNTAPAGAGGRFDRKFSDKYIEYLGVLSDGEVAEMVGVTRKAIVYHRKKMGIKASNNLRRMKPPPNMGGWNKHVISDSVMSNLGDKPDYILAIEEGVNKNVIARARRKNGIPPYSITSGNTGKFKKKEVS